MSNHRRDPHSCRKQRPLTVADLDLPEGISKAEANREAFDGFLILCVFVVAILAAVYELISQLIRAIF